VENGNGGPLTGAGSPRKAGEGAGEGVDAGAAVAFQSSAYAVNNRRKKLDSFVPMFSPEEPGAAVAGSCCLGVSHASLLLPSAEAIVDFACFVFWNGEGLTVSLGTSCEITCPYAGYLNSTID
jgi:hypothetical protein